MSIAVVTIAVADLSRSRRFYAGGFGWAPVFENEEIVFYQLNGLVFGTWLEGALAADTGRDAARPSGGFSLSHNVRTREDVQAVMARLITHGGRLLTPAKAPPFGGFHGHIADPDDHAWEICWNPAFAMAADGSVRFGA